VKFLGWFEDHETVYIAMEYLEEGNLTKHIGAPLSQETVQIISKQILEGLKVMHQQGITHRDIKPAVLPFQNASPNHVPSRNADKYIEYFCSFHVSGVGQTRGFRSVEMDPGSSYHNPSHPSGDRILLCS